MKPKNLKIVNNELYLGKYSLKSLASCYQTPLYVYDEGEILDTIDEYKKGFASNKFETEIVYASKAFLVPAICDIMKSTNLMIDAVSIGDLYLMKESNFDLNRVIFHGNNKADEELEFAVKNNIGLIVVDNLDELIRLEKIASEIKTNVKTLFRVNPGIDAHTHKYIQTALYVSKFGESIYDSDMINKIMNVYKNAKYVSLLGFHSHIGSQIHEMKPFMMNIDKMVNFTKEIENNYQVQLSYLNLGGGFGIKYLESDINLNLEKLLKKMITRIENLSKKVGLNLKKVFIEPGRSIVGRAGITLYKCGFIKKTYGGKNYLFVDGGMTDNIRPALYSAKYSCELVNNVDSTEKILVDVAGKCCESGDVIAHDQLINIPSIGDILAVYATGAYTYSMSSNYNGQLKPAVILIGDDVKLISKKEELKDLMYHFDTEKIKK